MFKLCKSSCSIDGSIQRIPNLHSFVIELFLPKLIKSLLVAQKDDYVGGNNCSIPESFSHWDITGWPVTRNQQNLDHSVNHIVLEASHH